VTTGQVLFVLLLSAAGATVQGSVGIGYGLVAGPGLAAIDTSFIPGPLLVIGILVGARHIFAEFDHIERPAVGRCFLGLPFGLVAGLAVLNAMDDRVLGVAVGAATALAAASMIFGFSVRRTPAIEVGSGAATAFCAVTAALPGPPFVVAFSDLRPAAMRSTASLFISSLVLISLVALAVTGNFAGEEARLLALLVPGTIGGLLLARYVRPVLERPWFRPLILVVAALGGIALVLRNI
jgi:uncharacterized membrane protein YfcA